MTDILHDIEALIPRLRRYARSLVHDVSAADDLVQETLARGLTKQHLWQRGTDLRAWLFTILHNQYVNRIRREIRAGNPVSIEDAALPGRPPDQEAGLELRDLERALSQLPEEQRSVILLIGLEGLPYADVAKVLGIPVGTVRSRLSRGRSTLRRLMTAEPGKRDAVAIRARVRETSYPPIPSLALA
jgi:RNA polymerase sigma-70 factor (ECF subfamily)